MASLTDLANAIVRQEGYGTPNAVTITTANNPGALRSSPFQTGTITGPSGTFATFASYADGFNALLYDLQSKTDQGLTLRSAIYKYAPPTENDTTGYLNNLSSWLGIPADTPLSALNGESGYSSDVSGNSGSNFAGVISLPDSISGDSVLIGAIVVVGLIAIWGAMR